MTIRRSLALFASVLALAACTRDEVALPLPAGFYPTAVAHSPREDAFYVAGLADGELVRVAPGADPMSVRSGDPALRVAVRGTRLWLLTPAAVEVLYLNGATERRVGLPAGFAPVDLAVWSEAAAFVLGTDGDVLRIDIAAGTAGRFARLAPRVAASPRAPSPVVREGGADSAASSAAELAAANGAIAAFPGAYALLAAWGGGLYRIDAQRATPTRIDTDTALEDVTQIVRTGDGLRGERIALFLGHANRVQAATLSRDLRTLTPDLSYGRYDAPFRGAWDGRSLRVLVGRLPHHPALAGDGRPPLPYRLAQRDAATGVPGAVQEVAMKTAPALP